MNDFDQKIVGVLIVGAIVAVVLAFIISGGLLGGSVETNERTTFLHIYERGILACEEDFGYGTYKYNLCVDGATELYKKEIARMDAKYP